MDMDMDRYVCPSDSVPLFKGGDGRDRGIGGIGWIGWIGETSRGGEGRPVFTVYDYDYVPSIGDTLQSIDSTTTCRTTISTTTSTSDERRATSDERQRPWVPFGSLLPPCAGCSFPRCLGYRAGANGRAWWHYVRCPGEQKPVASLGREHSPNGQRTNLGEDGVRGCLHACCVLRACLRACLSLLCIMHYALCICIWLAYA